MPISAASEALCRHLRDRLEKAGVLQGWGVEAMTLPEARTRPGHGIAFVLWRVQPDEPAAHGAERMRLASQGDPPRGAGLKLRYLLLVRGGDGAEEQTMLGHCMAVLDRHPVLEGEGREALVLSVEVPDDEAYLRLVSALGDPPPLVVPYAARSVRLRPPEAGRVPDPGGTEALD